MADLNDTNKLGTYHISSDLQKYEIARNNFFTLLVDVETELRDLVYPEFSYTGENAENEFVTSTSGKSGQEAIKLSVNRMFVPHFSTNPIEIRRGNSIVKFADVPSWSSGSLSAQDFVGLEVKNILMAWQALTYDVVSDTQGRAGDWDQVIGEGANRQVIHHKGYKRNCVLVEYSPDYEQIRYWDLIGCWISRLEEAPFESDGTGGREITITLEFDRAIMHQRDDRFSNVES